jgi:hypothetical protein
MPPSATMALAAELNYSAKSVGDDAQDPALSCLVVLVRVCTKAPISCAKCPDGTMNGMS